MEISALNSLKNSDYSVKVSKQNTLNTQQPQNTSYGISFLGAKGIRSAALVKNLSFSSNNKDIPSHLKILPTEENGEQVGVENLLDLGDGHYTLPDKSKKIGIQVENGIKYKTIWVKEGLKDELYLQIDKTKITDNKGIGVKFTVGKDGTVGTVSGKGFKAVAIPGSEITRPGFNFVMPKEKKTPGFGASLHPVLAFKPEASKMALMRGLPIVNEYSQDIPVNEELDGNYTVVQAIGGFGTRLRSLVPEDSNKTSVNTPAGIPLLAYSLIPVRQTGISIPDYIELKNTTIEKDPAVGTAGGLVEGIERGKISLGETLLVAPGDGIHDINMEPALKSFNENKQAGAMLIGNAVSQDQVKNFGIIGADKNGIVTNFIEKPKNPELAKEGIITDKDGNYDHENPKYNANIAVYAFKPPVAKAVLYLGNILRAGNIETQFDREDRLRHGSAAKEYDFGKHVMPALQILCNEDILNNYGEIDKRKFQEAIVKHGETHPLNKLVMRQGYAETIGYLNPIVDMIKDKKGERLKLVAYAGEADWADFGTIPQYIESSRKIASGEAFKNLPEKVLQGFRDNVDLETGIVSIPSLTKGKPAPKEKFNEFIGEHGFAQGNIVVMEP